MQQACGPWGPLIPLAHIYGYSYNLTALLYHVLLARIVLKIENVQHSNLGTTPAT
jgi:hypothetical protein